MEPTYPYEQMMQAVKGVHEVSEQITSSIVGSLPLANETTESIATLVALIPTAFAAGFATAIALVYSPIFLIHMGIEMIQ